MSILTITHTIAITTAKMTSTALTKLTVKVSITAITTRTILRNLEKGGLVLRASRALAAHDNNGYRTTHGVLGLRVYGFSITNCP